jgi:hypothetical protein
MGACERIEDSCISLSGELLPAVPGGAFGTATFQLSLPLRLLPGWGYWVDYYPDGDPSVPAIRLVSFFTLVESIDEIGGYPPSGASEDDQFQDAGACTCD